MGAPPEFPPAMVKAVQVGNVEFGTDIIIILGSLAAATLVYNVVMHSIRYIRTLACLNNEKQRFFRTSPPSYAFFKQHLLYAPLFNRRHSKQLRIGVVDMGMLPSRLQSILLAGIIGVNIAFTVIGIEWNGTPPDNPMPQQTLLQHLRNRSGTLAIFNMIPLIIMAGRNNPLITWLGVPFDTFILLHRWFGRIVVSFAIVHSAVEFISMGIMAGPMHTSGASFLVTSLGEEPFILWGFIAFLSMLIILLTSLPSFRHAFYETFLHIHIVLVALTLAGLYLHLDNIPTQNIIKILISLWVIERLIRLIRLLYRNLSLSSRPHTHCSVETLPGDAMRVNIHLARPWTFQPNQHVYLTIPSIGLWTSHPFSVAWSDNHPPGTLSSLHNNTPNTPPLDPEKALPSLPPRSPQPTISLLIRRRTGFTNTLYARTLTSQGTLPSLTALLEGPYPSSSPPALLSSYGTLLLIAGGIGITHSLPHIRALIHAFSQQGTSATRRITLVWIVRSAEHLEWIRPWMTEILAMEGRREVLRVQIYVTQPRDAREVRSPSATVMMFPGKPDLDAVVGREVDDRGGGVVGAMGVAVCGPGGLVDGVRGAVRRRLMDGDGGRGRNIDFVEEGFGW